MLIFNLIFGLHTLFPLTTHDNCINTVTKRLTVTTIRVNGTPCKMQNYINRHERAGRAATPGAAGTGEADGRRGGTQGSTGGGGHVSTHARLRRCRENSVTRKAG